MSFLWDFVLTDLKLLGRKKYCTRLQ